MKVAVTSKGNSYDSEISPVFGRCPYFVIVNMRDGEIKGELTTENPARNVPGAGNKAAEFIVKNEVKTLISEAIGSNAFNILSKAGIKVYKVQYGSVKDNLELFAEGKLEEITSASLKGPEGKVPVRRIG